MKIFDLHNDLATATLSREEKRAIIAENFEERVVIYAVWATNLSVREFITNIEFLREETPLYSIEDASVASDDFSLITTGSPVCCSLTWNFDNQFAGGALGKSGLTTKGKRFIEFMNANGVALDVAHLNDKSFYDAIDVADRVIATHVGLTLNKRHPRNLNCNQIELLIKKGGIVGLAPVPDFIRSPKINSYISTIKQFTARFGWNNVAIGSDYFGCDAISGVERYDALAQIILRELGKQTTPENIYKLLYKNADNFVIKRRA